MPVNRSFPLRSIRCVLRTVIVSTGVLVAGCASSRATFEPPASAWPQTRTAAGQAAPAAPAAEKAAATEAVTHTVRRGETLYRIAKNYRVTVQELQKANKLRRSTKIAVGQTLVIPGKVRAVEPAADDEDDLEVLEASSEDVAETSTPTPNVPSGWFGWPMEGKISSRFGIRGRRNHGGIDITAPMGTPVVATHDGEVTFAGRQGRYGLLVVIQHEDGLTSMYSHLQKIKTKVGKKVKQGQRVGLMGRSGNATGPHLHFEIRRDGVPIDPLSILPQ